MIWRRSDGGLLVPYTRDNGLVLERTTRLFGQVVPPDPEPSDDESFWKIVDPVTHGSQITPNNVGVPPGVTLTTYTGSNIITTPNVHLNRRTINGDLYIRALGFRMKECRVNGSIIVNHLEDADAYGATLIDSTIAATPTADTALGAQNIKAIRVRITGSRRSCYASYNTHIEECYMGGQVVSPNDHASCLRHEQYGTFLRNNLSCDPPSSEWGAGGGVSATITGYGDFVTLHDNDFIDNYFRPTAGGYGVYGGSTNANFPNAYNIRFLGNLFEKGPSGKNGFYGPVTGFNPAAPGNEWLDNFYTDGAIVNP